jgi:hypothetical protein
VNQQQDLMTRLSERVEGQLYGKFRGIVHENQDPLQLGRLRLKIPSLLADDDDSVTDWAWPCVPFGGLADQGAFFIPEIGALVWVEFEEGNADLPIWVGTFWSRSGGTTGIPKEARNMEGGDKPEPQRRVLKTPSGHSLEFSDVKDKESVTLKHRDGALVSFDEKGNAILANKEGSLIYLNAADGEICVADEHGNTIKMADSGVMISNKDGSFIDLSGESIQLVAKNVMLRSQTVALGEGAMEPAILGMTFGGAYDGHTHMTAFGPSSPPLPVPMPLSVPTNPAVSKVVKVK